MVLNDLLNRPATKRVVLENLRRFYDSVEDVTTKVHAGVVETLFHERGLREAIPATRLSDGTLRFLSLLTILCHPAPPPLVCIEDPEFGLHPDVLPLVAELMFDAAQRTQLIVTTHSDILVSALSGVPECIIVCEKDDRGTRLRRLEPAPLRNGWKNTLSASSGGWARREAILDARNPALCRRWRRSKGHERPICAPLLEDSCARSKIVRERSVSNGPSSLAAAGPPPSTTSSRPCGRIPRP